MLKEAADPAPHSLVRLAATERDRAPCRHAAHLARPNGHHSYQEGTPSDRCYILVDGAVEIIKSAGTEEECLLARREAGILLGEMSLFSQEWHHTASVRAATPLELLVMTDADLDALLHRQPRLAYDLVGMIARRLEQSENNTILELREKNRQLTLAYQELKAAQARLVEQERLEREMEIARQIQSSTLPRRLPHLADYDFGALISPARAVGGDFYDISGRTPRRKRATCRGEIGAGVARARRGCT